MLGLDLSLGTKKGLGVGAITYTAWNPNDTSPPYMGFANANLTATLNTTDGFFCGTRSRKAFESGKVYWELTPTVVNPSILNFAGISNRNQPLTGNVMISLDDIAWFGNGNVTTQGSGTVVIQTWASGNTLCFAVDCGAKLIWFRTNGGNWNNNASANPATGVGGISFASMNVGPYHATAFYYNLTDSYVANFGASAFAQAKPAGFSTI